MPMYLYAVLIWKITDIIISITSPQFIPYLGFFSYGKDMLQYHLPAFIRALSNFDGIFYVRIALKGYSYTEQAYFPIYPILIRVVNIFVQNPIITGVLISHAAFFLGFIVLNRYLPSLIKPQNKLWVLIFLLAYPTSYYFGVMYTESLFFLFLISTLFFARRKRFLIACGLAYLTALTRFIGVFLIIPLGLIVLKKFMHKRKHGVREWAVSHWRYIVLLIAPIAGLATYCLYLFQTTGDPLFFFHTQENFGAQRSTSLILPPQVIYRYIRIFMTADHNFQYFVAILELCFYIGALAFLAYDLKNILNRKYEHLIERLGLNLFSFVNILIPSLTGTLTALPRYSLMSLSLFFVLAEIEHTIIKYILLAFFVVLHVILFALFIQGYYVT